jgi:hypothetical protein
MTWSGKASEREPDHGKMDIGNSGTGSVLEVLGEAVEQAVDHVGGVASGRNGALSLLTRDTPPPEEGLIAARETVAVCNSYSLTKGQDAIRQIFGVTRDRTGNQPLPSPRFFQTSSGRSCGSTGTARGRWHRVAGSWRSGRTWTGGYFTRRLPASAPLSGIICSSAPAAMLFYHGHVVGSPVGKRPRWD